MKRFFKITVLFIFALMIGFSDSAFAGKRGGNNRGRNNGGNNQRRRAVGHTGKVKRMGGQKLTSKYTATAPMSTEHSTAAPVNSAALLNLIQQQKELQKKKEAEESKKLWIK